MAELRPRTIKLQCPSAGTTIEMAVWDQERVDLGYIARALRLDPPTIKLHGRFIATGLNFVASSVTWKSLLSFFASKGLSDQTILVHGNLAGVGTKRACEGWDSENGAFSVNSGRSTMEETDNKKKKMRNDNSGENGIFHKGPGCKRKQLLEELSPLKRLRINEVDHTRLSSDISAKVNNGVSKAISSTSFRCSPNDAAKRTRDGNADDAVLAAPWKRIR